MRIQGVGWADVYHWADVCARQVQTLPGYGPGPLCMLAIARGGLVPTALLAHRLKADEVHCVHARRYRDRQADCLSLGIMPSLKGDGTLLIVDDVYEGGSTMDTVEQRAKEMRPQLRLVTVALVNKHPAQGPKVFGVRLDPDTWPEFPWEKD